MRRNPGRKPVANQFSQRRAWYQYPFIHVIGLPREPRLVEANLLAVRTIDAEHAREREPSPKNASWTTPEELAASIVFLCSDEAAAINGARIQLHGRA
jgi:NAD(P)-dependent dehydrogenase (short-subunit alcohol dehydrogenase family)